MGHLCFFKLKPGWENSGIYSRTLKTTVLSNRKKKKKSSRMFKFAATCFPKDRFINNHFKSEENYQTLSSLDFHHKVVK